MIAFIDDYRDAHGVEPICRVLPIAPSTYHDHVARRADPARLSARAKRDAALRPEIARVFAENFAVWRAQGLASARARRPQCGSMHGGKADETDGPARSNPRQAGSNHDQRQGHGLSTRSRQPAIPCPETERAVGLRLHIRLDLDRLCLCRIRDRCLCPTHCRLAGQPHGARKLRARCTGTGAA
jgi:hypothetical protein